MSDSGYAGTASSKRKSAGRRLEIDINLGLSPYANAGEYYGEKKIAAVKEEKTIQQSEIALKNAEQKIAIELKKNLKLEKPTLQPIRKQMWFEKFTWFISTDGYLVLAGKDASQNETLYRRYLRKGDVYVHADLHGAPSVVIKNNPSTPDAPIPPSTLSQAGSLSACASSAWDSKAVMSAWWVNADQVSKAAPTGEYLPTGSFMVRGKKNFLPPAQLILGFGIMFKISDESKAHHNRHRAHYENEPTTSSAVPAPTEVGEPSAENVAEDNQSGSEESEAVGGDDHPRANPLQPTGEGPVDDEEDQPEEEPQEEPSTKAIQELSITEEPPAGNTSEPEAKPAPKERDNEDSEAEAETEEVPPMEPPPTQPAGKTAAQPQKKGQQPKRGQRAKAKKIAAKYKDQDEEDRAAIEALVGASAGRQKAEAAARAKAEREAQQEAARARRRAQHERQQRETAQHEKARQAILEKGLAAEGAADPATGGDDGTGGADEMAVLDALVGTPRPGDEILEAVAVCAPYAALARCKYKAKLQPGGLKKGKAVKEILERWKGVATAATTAAAAAGSGSSAKKGPAAIIDQSARDTEKMWPREADLLRALKPEDCINCVPVSKLRIVMSGGVGAGGGGGGGGGGGSGGSGSGAGGGAKGKKGGAGARGKKKK